MRQASIVAVIAAVLGPALVLGVAFAAFSYREPWMASDEIDTYDRILKRGADVVAVGNSKVASDLDVTVLGRDLAEEPLPVARLRQVGATGPSLYAMLKYRVVEAGHHPRLVLVFAHLPAMLATKLDTAHDLAQLTRHFAEPDDVLARKTLGGSPWLTHVRRRRSGFHDDMMDGLRYGAAGLVLGGTDAASTREATDAALDRIFAFDQVIDDAGRRRVIPIVEIRREAHEIPTDPESSYLPEMVALARQAGAEIVFVRSPVAPAKAEAGHVPPEIERRTVQLLNGLGAGWVDLTDMPVTEAHFMDAMHMNAEGRAMLTRELVLRLSALGVLSGAPLPPAVLPVVPTRWSREGDPPSVTTGSPAAANPPCGLAFQIPEWAFLDEQQVAATGHGPISPLLVLEGGQPLHQRTKSIELTTCSGAFAHIHRRIVFTPSAEGVRGDWSLTLNPALPIERVGFPAVWWVYPGTTLIFAFDDDWDPAHGPFRVRVQGTPFGTASGQVEVSANGQRAVLARDDALDADAVTRGDLVAVLAGHPPTGSWDLAIHSPSDGPFLAIRTLSFGEGASEDLFIGAESPAAISFLERPSRWTEHPLPRLPDPVLTTENGVGTLHLPGTAHLSDDHLQGVLLAGRCSPLTLTMDGTILTAGGHAYVQALLNGESGWTHVGDTILFRPGDGSDPLTGGHVWGVAWDPARSCRQRRWLLPGDTMVAAPRGDRLRLQRRPLGKLIVGAVVPGEVAPDLALGVILRSADHTWLETRVPLASLGFGVTLPLPEPVPLHPRQLEVELQLPSTAPPVILSKLILTDAEPQVAGP